MVCETVRARVRIAVARVPSHDSLHENIDMYCVREHMHLELMFGLGIAIARDSRSPVAPRPQAALLFAIGNTNWRLNSGTSRCNTRYKERPDFACGRT